MNSKLLESGLTVLNFARKNTLSFLEDVPEDKWCHCPIPGANHAMWIAGHLAHSDNFFVSSLAAQASKVPQAWDDLFGMGSKPQSDPAIYPQPAEMREIMAERREALLAWYRSLNEAKLIEPLPEDWRPFAPDFIGLAHSIAWHEGLHAGQLTVVRKGLGLAPKFG